MNGLGTQELPEAFIFNPGSWREAASMQSRIRQFPRHPLNRFADKVLPNTEAYAGIARRTALGATRSAASPPMMPTFATTASNRG